MVHDWSETWLQKVAGWRAVKEGMALARSGRVEEAAILDEECRGIVGGTKKRKVRIRRTKAGHVETFCNCPENQRSGAMCEHAVAIVTVARSQPAAKATRLETPQTGSTAERPAPASRIDFFPRWRDEWRTGRLSVKVSASARESDEGDEVVQRWFEKMRLTIRPQPWVLVIDRQQADAFFSALTWHSEVFQNDQMIVFSDQGPQVAVTSQRSGSLVTLTRVGESGQFFGTQPSSWLLYCGQLFQTTDRKLQNSLCKLFTEKLLKIPVNELLTDNLLMKSLAPTAGNEWLSRLESRDASASWEIEVDGGLQGLSLTCQAHYQAGAVEVIRSLHAAEGYLFEESNVCFYADRSQIAAMQRLLVELGWRRETDQETWVITEESAILHFFAEGRGRIRENCAKYQETQRLQNAVRDVIFINAKMDVREIPGSGFSLDLGFESTTGQVFDSVKMGQWLRAGKQSIQTNDGKRLVLPKESWDLFLMTARECHFTQEKGRFLAGNSQKIIIEYLHKYFDKSLNSNDLLNLNDGDSRQRYPAVVAELRDYQWKGVIWLQDRLEEYGFALLADEMGLGKTLQTIALLTRFAQIGKPALIVVPTTLLRNWESEIRRFAPSLKTLLIHGDKRATVHEQAEKCHVIVTSYGILTNDRALFMKREYSLMVLDEASMIRNPDTDVARSSYRISAALKMALTGTPVENSVRDLWSIFQFLQPGYLGERAHFTELYEKNAEFQGVARESLKLRVMPFVLRRTKEEVADDLPDKVEIDDWCDLSPLQKDLYQRVHDDGLAQLDLVALARDSAMRMKFLTLLLRLRQICCDTALFSPEILDDRAVPLEQRSVKMSRLMDLVSGSLASSRKMLVFSQFATQLKLIELELNNRSVASLRLDGASRDRQKLVDQFQSPAGPSVFLISLKAGGYGLNLTQASTVVHFDPWWNPAAERQASDRAHRIGQTNSVTIYKLLTRNTVEERVRKMQLEKSQVADQLFGQGFAPGGGNIDLSHIRGLLGVRA